MSNFGILVERYRGSVETFEVYIWELLAKFIEIGVLYTSTNRGRAERSFLNNGTSRIFNDHS